MNKKLLESLSKFNKDLRNRRRGLVESYNNSDSKEFKKKIAGLVNEIDTKLVEVRDAKRKYINLFEELKNTNDPELINTIKKEILIAENNLIMIAKKYKIDYVPETTNHEKESRIVPEPATSETEKTVTVPNKKNSKAKRVVGTTLAIAAAAALGAAGATAINNHLDDKETSEVEQDEEENKEEDKELDLKDKPFKTYGSFTNVNDEQQLEERAKWYHENYVFNNDAENNISLEKLKNDIRMINGEFALDENGEPTYNDTFINNFANDIYTIANYSSFSQYGNQINFVPFAPLFEDDSLAQKGAIELDKINEKVVKAIRNNNDEEFLKAAKEWGTTVLNMFEYIDFNGKYVNIHQVDAPTSYSLFNTMYATYGPTIFEYSQSHNLDICIPYCIDYNTGETNEIALSEMLYRMVEVPRDAVANRSGHSEEYAENNLSLSEDLYQSAINYFNSKYKLEIGSARVLK